jgi:hypothetical protein
LVPINDIASRLCLFQKPYRLVRPGAKLSEALSVVAGEVKKLFALAPLPMLAAENVMEQICE